METTTAPKLVTRKPSFHHVMRGVWAILFGGGVIAVQFGALWFDLTNSIYPFALLFAGLAVLAGIGMVVMGFFARSCGLCGRGLEEDKKVVVSERIVEHVAYGLQHQSVETITNAVYQCPPSGMEPRYDLELEYCPKCKQLAIATFKRPTAMGDHDWSSTPVTFAGPAVPALIDCAISTD